MCEPMPLNEESELLSLTGLIKSKYFGEVDFQVGFR